MLMAVEEKIVVAAAFVGQVIDHTTDVLTLEFGFNFCVGNEVDDVLDQVAEGITDSVR